MFRLYLATALLSFGLYGYAQYKGWSMFPSEAQQYQSARSSSSYGGSSGGGSSGHK